MLNQNTVCKMIDSQRPFPSPPPLPPTVLALGIKKYECCSNIMTKLAGLACSNAVTLPGDTAKAQDCPTVASEGGGASV